MKKLIPLLLIAFMASAVVAQNNSVKIISKKTDSVLNGTVYTIYGDGATKDVKEEFYAVMEKQDSMHVAITRREIQFIPNTYDYYCWYLCYTPEPAGSIPVWEAPDSLWIYQNDTVTDFSVYLQPEMNLGQAQYRYTFYPGDNPADSSWVDIVFDIVTVGIEEQEDLNISLYPNPAADFITIEGEFNDLENTIYEILDLNGRLVATGRLSSNRNQLSLPHDMTNNSYLVQIKNADAIIYKEIIQKIK